MHKSHSIHIDGMDLATLQYANVEKGLLNCIQFAIKSLQLNGEKRAFFSGFVRTENGLSMVLMLNP